MQVVLVCVVHAAQKTWYADKSADGDPDKDVTVPGGLTPFAAGTDENGRDSVDRPGPGPCIVGEYCQLGGSVCHSPDGRPRFPATTGFVPLTPE